MSTLLSLSLLVSLSACNTTARDHSEVDSKSTTESSASATDAAFVSSLKQAFMRIEEFDETPGISHVGDIASLPQSVKAAMKILPDGEAFRWVFKNQKLFIVIGFSPTFQGQIFDFKGGNIASGKEIGSKFVWNN